MCVPFHFHANQTRLHIERFYTSTCFEEVQGNIEMAYLKTKVFQGLTNTFMLESA